MARQLIILSFRVEGYDLEVDGLGLVHASDVQMQMQMALLLKI